MTQLLTSCISFFFFNDTATTEIYTLSLHDALPISWAEHGHARRVESGIAVQPPAHVGEPAHGLPDEIGAEQDLDDCQYVEECFHFLSKNSRGGLFTERG